MTPIDRTAILNYRLSVNHLEGPQLGISDLATAAHSGLQDGSPRSGLLSLAARIAGVQPDDWRRPELTQVFGPRGAVYIVPREDADIFTLGLLPRDTARLAQIEVAARRVHEVLDGTTMRQADLVAALPELGGTRGLRWAAALGTIAPIWDTVDTLVQPRSGGSADPEQARRSLAMRFFRYHGPATVADLQWWLNGLRNDAEQTVAAIAAELEPASFDARRLYVIGGAAHRLNNADQPPNRILLLPPDDVYLSRRSKSLLVPDEGRRRLLWPQAPPPGALVVGGEVIGTFRRRGGTIAITPWGAVSAGIRAQVENLAADLPLGPSITVHWLDPV